VPEKLNQRTFFTYIKSDSPLVGLHPLPKVTLLLAINFVALIIEAPLPFILLIILIALGFKLLHIPMIGIKKFVIVVMIASQAVLISYLLGSSIPGKQVYITFPWGTYVSEMTFLYAATMIMRYTTMLLGSTLVLVTTSDRDIVYGAAALKLPYTLGIMMSLAFRMATIFAEDFIKVRDAMILRGASFHEGPLLERAKKYANVFTSMIVIALRRLMDISYAIQAKGFGAAPKRTYYREYRLRGSDVVITALLIASVLSAYFLRYSVGILAFPGWIPVI
jgi:energy-coupling factor transport system permease protein